MLLVSLLFSLLCNKVVQFYGFFSRFLIKIHKFDVMILYSEGMLN